MLIYNTLTKKKEQFKPLNPPNVTMYVCGPTVYDYFHIGNARSFIMADVIHRYLEFKGYNVNFVMNLTDIEDKIIKKSNSEGVTAEEISGKFIDEFFVDIKKLKIERADIYPKATEHIGDIIKLIGKIEDNGKAYESGGNVFYNVTAFEEYGKLSGKNIEDLESGARVEVNEMKKNPLDFTLWKKAKDGEPFWESPWGKGRPGWHIECSAMSMKHLGETIDIHAGGSDLIFPHHENEIAQSESATSKQFVKYWIHFGFLNINDEKMSKSLGNFFTARDILKKYPAEAIRLLFCQTHYGAPLSFSEELLKSAGKGIEKIENLALKIEEKLSSKSEGNIPAFDFDQFYSGFSNAMDEDFNTPMALAVIFDFVRDVNKTIAENDKLSHEFFNSVKQFLVNTAHNVLGILDFDELIGRSSATLENDLILLLTELRLTAKKEKNYKLADEIRDKLAQLGIILEDGKEGTSFKKIKLP